MQLGRPKDYLRYEEAWLKYIDSEASRIISDYKNGLDALETASEYIQVKAKFMHWVAYECPEDAPFQLGYYSFFVDPPFQLRPSNNPFRNALRTLQYRLAALADRWKEAWRQRKEEKERWEEGPTHEDPEEEEAPRGASEEAPRGASLPSRSLQRRVVRSPTPPVPASAPQASSSTASDGTPHPRTEPAPTTGSSDDEKVCDHMAYTPVVDVELIRCPRCEDALGGIVWF